MIKHLSKSGEKLICVTFSISQIYCFHGILIFLNAYYMDILSVKKKSILSKEFLLNQKIKIKKEKMGSELKQDLVYMKMLSITNEFLKDPIAVYFTDPISQDDEFAAEYFDIIKHPMDLKTLKRNLMDNRYSSINEWAKDFNLIFENAITYNGEGNLISGSARYLQKKFSKKLKERLKH